MEDKSLPRKGQDTLLAELEGIRDVYRQDVKQFIAFLRDGKLPIVDGFRRYAQWLDEEHEGKRYSPATVNRKLAAARNRVRYAFKHSAQADRLQRKYQLEDILKSVKSRKVDGVAASSAKALDVEEARKLVWQIRDRTIRLMVTFLVRTGVQVSEMLRLKQGDLREVEKGLVAVRIRGKAGKERTLHVKKDLVEQIKEHFEGRTYLFEHGGKPYSRISVTNRIKHESLRILGREVSAQQLRHTWASIQIRKGGSVKAIAALMGHADPGTTARLAPEDALKPEEAFLDLDEPPRKGKTPPDGREGSRR